MALKPVRKAKPNKKPVITLAHKKTRVILYLLPLEKLSQIRKKKQIKDKKMYKMAPMMTLKSVLEGHPSIQ